MSWINWVYLGVGLALGVGSRWLFGRRSDDSAAQLAWRSKEPVPPTVTPEINSYIAANQDVPALLELKQTQLAYQLLQQTSQFKAGFLVRTSHELRSPLNSLIGLHQLILADLCDNPAEERQFVAEAHDLALKLVKLMDTILEVARIEHATNLLEIQPLQLAHVLQEVYDLTHLLAANNNFRLQLTHPEPEIYILADPRWLRQVLVNLVDTCIAQMELGSICVSAQALPATEFAYIWLDVPLSVSAWSEPVDLIEVEPTLNKAVQENAAPSCGLTLLLNQTLLELIQGRLEIFPYPTDADESHFTRIQLAIPLLTPENASLEPEGD